MNNEKLILEALWVLLKDTTKPLQNLKIMEKIERALNPKQDVPYEKSLEDGCGRYSEAEDRTCGHKYGYRKDEKRPYVKKKSTFDIWLCSKCEKKFAKSSGGERK